MERRRVSASQTFLRIAVERLYCSLNLFKPFMTYRLWLEVVGELVSNSAS